MLNYAQSPLCRNELFARYFDDPKNADCECGRCDNCLRPPSEKQLHDVSFMAWQAVRVAEEVRRAGGRITMPALADLARGLNGGQFKTANDKGQTMGTVDLGALIGGKVALTREVRVLAHLL